MRDTVPVPRSPPLWRGRNGWDGDERSVSRSFTDLHPRTFAVLATTTHAAQHSRSHLMPLGDGTSKSQRFITLPEQSPFGSPGLGVLLVVGCRKGRALGGPHTHILVYTLTHTPRTDTITQRTDRLCARLFVPLCEQILVHRLRKCAVDQDA
jgi:hypothetical protein